jgi:LysM repeat protein
MQAARQVGSGLFYALISIVLVVGGLSLALAENKIASTVTSTPVVTALPQTITSAAPTPVSQTQVGSTQASLVITPTILPLPTQTSPALTNCNPPSGWIFIIVQSGESLASIAAHYRITPQQLATANCLPSQFVAQGSGIYVPPLPANTMVPCGPFVGWIRSYVVQPGDTLFHIATLYRTTVQDLQRANCKSNSTIIFTGDRLWVPNVPTITPGVTIIPTFTTPTEIPSGTPTSTQLPFTATIFPTATILPIGTSQPDLTATP